ncbi:transporter substrate-binding domain-containing protein [Massilia sp. R2A-15]|uniref:substrate-binding periplasmic protein n=1 Tax=Massilia sp. R2A-15 TaxID=3064278 RepID=UPI002735674C|nr:transporter substrate-binding domain-containing protein [Massilia sp. R2A-15]WLI88547.1 transporter substrate-binding domain-containing protein [Massilia sp. R2A-15]
MGFRNAALAVLLAVAASMAHGATQPVRLHLITEASAPISMMEGRRVIGSGTEKVAEIMARTGTDYTLELLPWKRGYTFALQRPDTCLFSTTRTAERENLFKWIGPTDEAEWILLGRADRHYDLRTLDDARGLRIGTYNGDARDEYLRARGFQVDPAPNDMINPRKLLMDRIDVWAASFKRGTTVLKRHGWGDKIVPVLSFNRVGVYLACNPAVPTELVDRMNVAVEAMVRDGTMKRIDRKYEKWVDDLQAKR